MAISSTPTGYSNLCTGRLAQKLTTSQTSAALVTADTFKTPAGTSSVTWPTGNQIWKVSRKTRTNTEVEFIGVESLSQTGTAITTGTIIRYLSPTDGTSFTSQGSGLSLPAGCIVELVWDVRHAENTAFKNNENTFTAAQTISGNGTYLAVPQMTTANAPAATNARVYYDTTKNQWQFVEGGSPVALGAGSVADGSATVAGKFEEATVAEQGSATATGGTGARLVPAVANLVKTSSGAGDENKLAVLNSSGTYNIGFLATGTPTGTKFIRDDNTLQTIPSTYYGTGVDGALSVTSGTTTLDFAGASFLIKEYSSISISSGATLAVSNVSSSGGLLVLLCSGNVTIAGTIDLSGKGSSGGSAVSNTISGVTNSLINGAAGTTVFNTFQQLRVGGAGNGASSGGTNAVAASGGGGGSNVATAGTASSVATSGAASAAASTASVAITTSILTLAASARCLTVGPGAGGGSGGHGWEVDTYTSGSSTFLSGAGGTGGGGLYIACKGNYTDAGGTINLSASNGGTASNSGTLSATNYAIASGGGGGGAGGTGIAVVGGTITATGTYTVTGGTGGVGETLTNGGHGAAKSDGGAGAAGLYIVTYAS